MLGIETAGARDEDVNVFGGEQLTLEQFVVGDDGDDD